MTTFPGRHAEGAAANPRTAAATILVVDDEALIRVAVSDYLSGRGYRVVEAGNSDEAVDMMKTGIRIDVVFADIRMPGRLDGIALGRWIRRERPAAQLVLTSGDRNAAREVANMRNPVPFLAKPYDPADVERMIRQSLGRTAPSSGPASMP